MKNVSWGLIWQVGGVTCCITHRVWLLWRNETEPNAAMSVLKDGSSNEEVTNKETNLLSGSSSSFLLLGFCLVLFQ